MATAFDTETTGLRLAGGEDHAFAFSTCTEDGTTVVQRVDREGPDKVAAGLRRLWNGECGRVVMHNALFDLQAAETFGVHGVTAEAAPPWEDTELLARLTLNANRYGLKELSHTLGGYPRKADELVRALAGSGGKGYEMVPAWAMDPYQQADAERGMLLWLTMRKTARGNSEYTMEKDLILPTIRMVRRGVHTHVRAGQLLLQELVHEAHEIEAQWPWRGQPISSVDAVRQVLFGRLGLKPIGQTGTGLASTRRDELLELRDSLPSPPRELDMILHWRAVTKGAESVRNYLAHVSRDGAVHPDLHTNEAITGRESCSTPNLQQMHKGERAVVRAIPVRRMFGPRPGHVTLHIDYKGIEMLLIIHYTQDPGMLAAMPEVHECAADVFYGSAAWRNESESVRQAMRTRAKNGSFAMAYGASAIKLGRTLHRQPAEAMAAHQRYRAAFPEVGRFARTIAGQARQAGHVCTAFGRRLFVPAERAFIGANYLIQGTAAGIIKRAQIRVDRILQQVGHGSILLPIHDELIIEWPVGALRSAPTALHAIRQAMIDFNFSVPLEVEMSMTDTDWDSLKPLPEHWTKEVMRP